MKWLRSIGVLGLLGLWLAATNHCRLEQFPGLGFLACCAESGSSQDNECQADGCAQLEDGLYKTEKNNIQIVTAVSLPIDFLATISKKPGYDLNSVCKLHPGRLTDVPPDLPQSWLFFFRAAAPPRAPSFAS